MTTWSIKQNIYYVTSKSSRSFGEHLVVYNVHSLIHLADDVLRFKTPLSSMDAFPFENYLQVIKRMVRNATQPCKQIVKRVEEVQKARVGLHKNVFSTYVTEGGRDSWFLKTDGSICRVVGIEGKKLRIVTLPSKSLENFFTDPVESKLVGIYKIKLKTLSGKASTCSHQDLKRKLVCLVHKKNVILTSLNHDCVFKED